MSAITPDASLSFSLTEQQVGATTGYAVSAEQHYVERRLRLQQAEHTYIVERPEFDAMPSQPVTADPLVEVWRSVAGLYPHDWDQTLAKLAVLAHELAHHAVASQESIAAQLADHPIESGIAHPAEGDLYALLRVHNERLVPFISYCQSHGLWADGLRLLGRIAPEILSNSQRIDVIGMGISSRDAEVREAAVNLVEAWRERAAVSLLLEHSETQPWLRHYIDGVIADFEG